MSLHTDHHHGPPEGEQPPGRAREAARAGFWRSKTGLVTIAFLLIGAFFLVTEHRAHLLGWLPWLILLACPLLHMFMHGGHGGHGSHGGHRGPESPARSDTTPGDGV